MILFNLVNLFMKKFIFSAVALVAFSFAGMASEVEINQESFILNSRCNSIAHDTYHTWIGNGFSDEVARAKANEAKAACL